MVLFLLSITVKLTGHEGLSALRCAVNQDDGEILAGHQVHDVEKLPDERGRNGAVLNSRRVKERKHLVFLLLPVPALFGVIVQGPRLDGDAQSLRRVLDHLARALSELVKGFLVAQVNVGSDDFHSKISFLPV